MISIMGFAWIACKVRLWLIEQVATCRELEIDGMVCLEGVMSYNSEG